MNDSTLQAPHTAPADPDLGAQALPGHGVPSQDPNPAAQVLLAPAQAEREAKSVMAGGGMVGGAAVGAGIGMAVAGPVGAIVGGSLGAMAGALGSAAAGGMGTPQTSTADLAAPADALHLHIEDTGGPGRPVVLIHGWPLSAQAWQHQVPALQGAGYRVLAYDRRGFGQSDKPASGYDYDTLADDLQRVMDQCGLQDVTLVGFSMGGGEVARYVARHGESRLHSVVFAAAVTPCMMQSADNPDGPLTPETAQEKSAAFERDRATYFHQFTTAFFSAAGVLQVTEAQRRETLALCEQSAPHAALACMASFATTDFRDDLKKLTVPVLVIHGSADGIVPLEGSGLRTHRAVPHSRLVQVNGAPHGLNVSHAPAFNDALLTFLKAGMQQEEKTSFGVFKPVGHTVISFPSAHQADAARAALGRMGVASEAIQGHTDREMLAQVAHDIRAASPLASIGQEMNLVLAHRALAELGYHWLVVHTPNDDLARQVAACVKPLGAERAQLYGHFIIEELITHADAQPQVAESPARQLDAATPSGREEERAALRPAKAARQDPRSG